MRSGTWVRRSGVLAMLGGTLWMVSWICNAFTADGTRAVMGLSERGWRIFDLPLGVQFMPYAMGVILMRRAAAKHAPDLAPEA